MTDPSQIASDAVISAATAHQEAVEVAREVQTTAIVAKAMESIVPMADLVMIKEYIQEAVTIGINKDVNGGVKAVRQEVSELRHAVINYNLKHEADMAQLKPIVLAWQFADRRVEDSKAIGKVAMWIGLFLTAVFGAIIMGIQLFKHN